MPNITKLKLQDDIEYTLSAPILLDQEESTSTTSAPSSNYLKTRLDNIENDIYDTNQTIQTTKETLQSNIDSKLSLSGGTLTGLLKTPNSTYVTGTNRNPGTAGYYKMITIKHINNYSNSPIIFMVSQRGINPFGILSIMFSNNNDLDPTVQNFYKTGNITETYACKSATSTWDIYIKKSELYDCIGIIWWGGNMEGYLMTHVQVTFPCTFHTSIPSGGIAPTTTSLWGA